MKKPNEKPKTMPRMAATKTNHQPGYHKPIVNPTTNYPKDTHKEFCRRCLAHHAGCPITNRNPAKSCSL